jgi:2-succinyl-5-enolpyruvyl-6-hydroxy-3-cyclohexene-1-carboxylate synthase
MNHLGDVEGVFFCAGARNHLLLNEFQRFPLYMEIDERIASYKALGLSKSRNKLTVICTTSGTAVSECLSAIIEAFYSDAPLLLVSADRPIGLRDSGAPQTINHEVITRGFRKEYLDINLDEFHLLDFSKLQFPAHVNVRITSQDEKESHDIANSFSDFKSFMSVLKNPLFLFSHDSEEMRPLIEKFATFGLPFYAEVDSGAKELSPIKTEKKLLKLFSQGVFDGVVRVGHTPLSKLWRILEGKRLPIYSFDSRGLKGLSYGNVEKLSIKKLQTYAPFWNWLHHKAELIKDETVSELHSLCRRFPSSEVSLMKNLHDLIPSGSKVFLGNSLPIRYFELVQDKKFHIMANRGVNGIDGQLATAHGWSLSTQDTVYCILGDMTLSYDLSSLLSFSSNLKCIVINNSGGRIFETLQLDHRLVMEHKRNFKEIAMGFGLRYSNSLKDFSQAQIIELIPDLDESKEFLKEWRK